MLSNYLSHENIILNLQSSEKEEAFAELLEVIVKQNPGINRDIALNAIITREEKMSTAVIPCIAVPHATYNFSLVNSEDSSKKSEKNKKKSPDKGILSEPVDNSIIAMGISRRGIEFDSPNEDNSVKAGSFTNVNIIIEILFDENDAQGHLHLLRDILKLVSDKNFYSKVMAAKDVQEILDYIHSIDV